jgi:hypothetical protein
VKDASSSVVVCRVVFEEDDTPNLKTVKSVARLAQGKGAWFKESKGNLLAVDQFD